MYYAIILSLLVVPLQALHHVRVTGGNRAHPMAPQEALERVHPDDRLGLTGRFHLGNLQITGDTVDITPPAHTAWRAPGSLSTNRSTIAAVNTTASLYAFSQQADSRHELFMGRIGSIDRPRLLQNKESGPSQLLFNDAGYLCAVYPPATVSIFPPTAGPFSGSFSHDFSRYPALANAPIRAAAFNGDTLALAIKDKIVFASATPAGPDRVPTTIEMRNVPFPVHSIVRYPSYGFLGATDESVFAFDSRTGRRAAFKIDLAPGEKIKKLFRTKAPDEFIIQIEGLDLAEKLYKLKFVQAEPVTTGGTAD